MIEEIITLVASDPVTAIKRVRDEIDHLIKEFGRLAVAEQQLVVDRTTMETQLKKEHATRCAGVLQRESALGILEPEVKRRASAVLARESAVKTWHATVSILVEKTSRLQVSLGEQEASIKAQGAESTRQNASALARIEGAQVTLDSKIQQFQEQRDAQDAQTAATKAQLDAQRTTQEARERDFAPRDALFNQLLADAEALKTKYEALVTQLQKDRSDWEQRVDVERTGLAKQGQDHDARTVLLDTKETDLIGREQQVVKDREVLVNGNQQLAHREATAQTLERKVNMLIETHKLQRDLEAPLVTSAEASTEQGVNVPTV